MPPMSLPRVASVSFSDLPIRNSIQLVRILCELTVPHVGPAKDPCDRLGHMFDLRTDHQLCTIAGSLEFTQ